MAKETLDNEIQREEFEGVAIVEVYGVDFEGNHPITKKPIYKKNEEKEHNLVFLQGFKGMSFKASKLPIVQKLVNAQMNKLGLKPLK